MPKNHRLPNDRAMRVGHIQYPARTHSGDFMTHYTVAQRYAAAGGVRFPIAKSTTDDVCADAGAVLAPPHAHTLFRLIC